MNDADLALAVLLPVPYTDDGGPQGEDPFLGLAAHPDGPARFASVSPAIRAVEAAIRWGRRQISAPSQDWTRLCLSFVRQAYNLPAVYPSAIAAWNGADLKRHTTNAATIPRGAPVFWQGGTWGHVAISLGDGTCLSNDVRRRGRIDRVRIDAISAAWGFRLLGYTRDLNGYSLPRPVLKPTRVTNAHAKGEELLTILDRAVRSGRTGAVKASRDQIREALKGLPPR